MLIGFIYSLLYLLTMFFLYISGKYIAEERMPYWSAALIGIIAYTFDEGLRFGRGIDYNLYYELNKEIVSGSNDTYEYLFVQFLKGNAAIGGSWQVAVFIMSLFFIFSVYVFMQDFKKVSPYALPLVIPVFFVAENLMRWFFSFSFVLIGMHFLFKGKLLDKFIYWGLCIIAILVHKAMIPIAFLFFMLRYQKKAICSFPVALALFLFLSTFFSTEYMISFIDLFQALSFLARTENYANNAEYWLSGGYGGNEVKLSISIVFFMIVSLYIAYRYEKLYSPKYMLLFNLFILGFIFYPFYRRIELFARYGYLLTCFSIIFTGVAFRLHCINKIRIPYALILVFILSVANLMRTHIVPSFSNPKCYLFVWDKKGKEYIDAQYFFDKEFKK